MRCATSSPMYGDPEASHRMCNELSLWLKWLVIPVQCSRVFLTRGQNERGESRKRHESVMNSAMNSSMDCGPKCCPTWVGALPGREDCRARPPSDQLNFSSAWREERRSLPDANR